VAAMSQSLYQLYQNDVFTLALTTTINHVAAANVINANLVALGHTVNYNDPTTWKYYMNMAGLYHPTDIANLTLTYGYPYMQIQVAGNTGPIVKNFNTDPSDIDGISSDLSTLAEYSYGSGFYNALNAAYPGYEMLIDGILNPIPIDISTSAPDGTILYCGGYVLSYLDLAQTEFTWLPTRSNGNLGLGLVEVNETNLIQKLQNWVTGYLTRWDNSSYGYVDDLYLAGMLGVMYLNFPMAIMNARLENCKTPHAHSYHIREYLESYGKLSRYVPYMATAETLWLYRNVAYINANVGKQATFNALVTNLLTPANVPLAGYNLSHNLSQMPTQLDPTATMIRYPINFIEVGAGSDERTIDYLLGEEIGLGRDNGTDLVETAIQIEDASVYSLFNNLPTKVLESEMIDNSDAIPFPLLEYLLNQWLFLASNGLYVGSVYVTHPISGLRLQFTPLNAYILALYCFNRAYGNITLDLIPTIPARMVPRSSVPLLGVDPTLPLKPTLAELRKCVDSKLVPDTELISLIGNYNEVYHYASPEAFFVGVSASHAELMRRYYEYVRNGDNYGRAMGEMACSKLYWLITPCKLDPGVHYSDWLTGQGIDLVGLQPADFVNLATDLVSQATGNLINLNQSLRNTQNAMIGIIKHFSSYTVQYIASVTNGSTMLMDPKYIRGGNQKVTWSDVKIAQVSFETDYDLHVDVSDGAATNAIGTPNPLWAGQEVTYDLGMFGAADKVGHVTDTIGFRVDIARMRPSNITDTFVQNVTP
jgi:hypothetical protein